MNTIKINQPEEHSYNNPLGDIKSVSNWRRTVSKWIELVEDEETILENDVNLLENTMADEDLEFVDTFSIIHPADDIEAKWKLRNLFKDSLGQPAYLTLIVNE